MRFMISCKVFLYANLFLGMRHTILMDVLSSYLLLTPLYLVKTPANLRYNSATMSIRLNNSDISTATDWKEFDI